MIIRAMYLFALCSLFITGCGDDDPATPSGDQAAECPDGPMLTVSPIAIADIESVFPLGNINPPGHICPTDHMGLTIRTEPGAAAPIEVDLVSPGDLTVVQLSAQEFVNAGYADFGIGLQACDDIHIGFGHVTTLDEDLFGFAGDFADWTFQSETVTAEETYRYYHLVCEVDVVAGQRLGTGGGVEDQWGVDFSVYDLSLPPAVMASARWDGEWSLYARCCLDYFVDGPVHDALYALQDLPASILAAGDACGNLHDDVPGALRGCWFLAGTILTYPDENNISFSCRNTNPGQALIGVGSAVPTVPGAAYFVDTVDTGHENRVFDQVTPAGGLQVYMPTYPSSLIILVQLVAADTLWIEGIPAGLSEEAQVFSEAKTIFVR